jgi:hypothetical protein
MLRFSFVFFAVGLAHWLAQAAALAPTAPW